MEWDESKSEENRVLSGFGFEIAYDFNWDDAFYRPDLRRDYGEDRIVAYSHARGMLLAIVFTPRDGDRRIISIRRVHAKEARRYGL